MESSILVENSISLCNVEFGWSRSAAPTLVIPTLTVPAGERVFLLGPSGSGKSTLINLLAGISQPRSGELHVLGQRISTWSGARRDRFRVDHIGLIFQQFNLLPYLSVIDNVLLPCQFSPRRRAAAQRGGPLRSVAQSLLSRLGLPDTVSHRPVTALSVGQQQRVAVARALIGAPELIIADEPTSALDADSRDRFIELLFANADAAGSTIIFVSHDRALAPHFQRTLSMCELNTAALDLAAAG